MSALLVLSLDAVLSADPHSVVSQAFTIGLAAMGAVVVPYLLLSFGDRDRQSFLIDRIYDVIAALAVPGLAVWLWVGAGRAAVDAFVWGVLAAAGGWLIGGVGLVAMLLLLDACAAVLGGRYA